MLLQQYIKELLYHHECVTVPNFGAFLTRSVPVLIHPDTDVFSPPKKEVSFNSLLKSNDGILANYMAKKEKVSYEQALRKIEREVIVWKQRLNTQHLSFAGIGEMQLNPHKRISFSPYGSINFDLSSFGLGRFTRKAIHPLKINESPKSPPIMEKGKNDNMMFTPSKKEEKTLYYSFTNYHSPGVIYSYEPKTQTSKKYWSPEIDFNPDDYISTQVFYTSNDGTKVPMIITHKKGVDYNGKNPTILYGYGGFNISLRPSFSITNAVWMEQGGVYAVPNIRGGGEYGKEWHQAGIQQKKQNVFDDFIAAAEYLIAENITSPEFLAVRGGSNGGLLVGAVMTQRPELVKVALPAVGVLDMLRYHKFTSGAGWSYDYGTSEDSAEMFTYLKGYSPVHNVNADTRYPATLITTGDHDDRVVPAHSFKFAAELQDKQQGDNPVLIRIETNAGHGAGTPVSKTIEQYADVFGFTLYNMGFRVLPETIKSKPKG